MVVGVSIGLNQGETAPNRNIEVRIKQAFPRVPPLVGGVGEDHVGRCGAKKVLHTMYMYHYGMKSPGKANSRIRTQDPESRPRLSNSECLCRDDLEGRQLGKALSPWATRCTRVLNFEPSRRNTSRHLLPLPSLLYWWNVGFFHSSSLAQVNRRWRSRFRTLVVPFT